MILVISGKNYASQRLLQEAADLKVPLQIMSAAELKDRNFKIDVDSCDVLYIRNPYIGNAAETLPKIIELAQKFKAAGKRVIDEAVADGKLGQGKWVDYQNLLANNISIPKTYLLSDYSPPTTPYPLVLKWTYGLKGRHVFLVRDKVELDHLAKKYPQNELLLQEYIDADWEFEVYVVGYKSIAKVLAYKAKNGFKADVKNFKIFESADDYQHYQRLMEIASLAAKVLGRELCKVDILEKNGKFYILEVNRNPGLVSFERLIGYNIARDFVNYLITKTRKV